jgi:hypothetical protein
MTPESVGPGSRPSPLRFLTGDEVGSDLGIRVGVSAVPVHGFSRWVKPRLHGAADVRRQGDTLRSGNPRDEGRPLTSAFSFDRRSDFRLGVRDFAQVSPNRWSLRTYLPGRLAREAFIATHAGTIDDRSTYSEPR